MIMFSNIHSRHLHAKPFLFNYCLEGFATSLKGISNLARKWTESFLCKDPRQVAPAWPWRQRKLIYSWKVAWGSTPRGLGLPNFHTHWKSLGFPHWFHLGPTAQSFPKIGKSLLPYHIPFASIGGSSSETKESQFCGYDCKPKAILVHFTLWRFNSLFSVCLLIGSPVTLGPLMVRVQNLGPNTYIITPRKKI